MANRLDNYLQKEMDTTLSSSYILKRIMKYIKPYRKTLILTVCLYVILAVFVVLDPIIVGKVVDVVANVDGTNTFKDVVVLGSLYIVVMLANTGLQYINSVLVNKMGQSIIYDLRKDIFAKIETLGIGQINEIPVGKWVNRITNDTNGLMMFFSSVLTRLLYDTLTLISIFGAIYFLEWRLALLLTGFFPVIVIIAFLFSYFSKKYHRAVRANLSEMNAFLSESLSGMNTIQIFNKEEMKMKEFKFIIENLKKVQFKATDIFAIFRPVIVLINYLATIGIFGIGVLLVRDGICDIGTVYTFHVLSSYFFNPVQEIADQFNNIQQAFASAERLVIILDTDASIRDKEEVRDIGRMKGKIEFKHVWFAYKDEDWILKDVSFVINPGDTVAFVGETGAGKSTIIGLIVRNYDIQRGQILIDDVDIKDISLECLRKNIGEMLQDVFLFSGTLKSNISLNEETITDDDIVNACHFVGADRFIEKLPDKYEEKVLENGNNLPQGQRQLISFARAVAFKPSVIVLDEATANIDTETEVIIQESLEKIKSIGTMVMIAHRLSTIRHATKIYVVDKGMIVEEGSHQELLKKRGIYYNLYRIQNMEKEIEKK